MAWRKHNRHVSEQQFADSTTIDGSRVEDALQDVEDHVNEVPEGDIKQRFMQTQIVAGYSPHAEGWVDGTDDRATVLNVMPLSAEQSTAVTGAMFPWLPVYNSAKNLSQIAPVVTPDRFTNPHRIKGYRVPGVSIEPEEGFGFEQGPTGAGTVIPEPIYEETGQYAWEMSWAFKKPVVVAKVTIFLLTDDITNNAILAAEAAQVARMPFRNDFLFDNPPVSNPPYSANSPSEDLLVQLSVDDLFLREDRSLASVELTRHRFQITKENVTQIAWSTASPAYEMEPMVAFAAGIGSYPGGQPSGCVVDLDCDIPVPEDSRARLSIMIPKYDKQQKTPAPSGWPVHGGGKGAPWFRQYYTVCLTLLEEIG